ncbi:MAG TPA: phosphatidate cytidylyltransferase, partial [Candidatus Goldiibacteriota bacterium]|nr:phosphatidate cytidylyltransferase [Candidatus Goldiibacteriota bacterium]
MLTRILVAAVLSPIVIFFVFSKNPYFFIGIAVIFLTLALNEMYSMLDKKKMKAYAVTGNIFSLVTYVLVIIRPEPAFYFACFGFFVMTCLAQVIFSRDEKNLLRVFYTVLPVAYITTLGTFGIHLRMLENGSWHIFLLLLLTLVYDSGAYFAGTAFGRTKLIPELSPGKSVEGCVGGVIVNLITGLVIYFTLLPKGLLGEHGWIHMAVLSVLLAFTGQIG